MCFNTYENKKNNVTVIECPESLTADISDSLKELLHEKINESKYRLVIDLADTEHIDSSGLGAIVSRIAAARSNNGDIRIASACKYIGEMLELTHLDKILMCYQNSEEAINSFKK